MATTGRSSAVIDTSVLLNFVAVDRADLLAAHPHLFFVITDHVRGEVTDRRPGHLERFEKAQHQGFFDPVSIVELEELSEFAKLLTEGRLDVGESAAAAHAVIRGFPLATDDRRAKKILARYHPTLKIIDTVSIMRDLIEAAVITVDEANAIKQDWETNHRFKLPFKRF